MPSTAPRYVQGWLIGDDGAGGGSIVPYELAIRPGLYRMTTSGPVTADVADSLWLCCWAVQLVLTQRGMAFGSFDCHLNLPLHRMQGTGPSCRLALAYGLLAALTDLPLVPPDSTALTGDLTLGGDVVPIGNFANKVAAIHAADIPYIIVAHGQDGATPDMVRIRHLSELLGAWT